MTLKVSICCFQGHFFFELIQTSPFNRIGQNFQKMFSNRKQEKVQDDL